MSLRKHLVLLALLMPGCVGPLPRAMHAPFARSVLATRAYRIIETGVYGKACDLLILGISTGDSSYLAAMDDLRAKVKMKYGPHIGEYLVINQMEDWDLRYYVLALRKCTIISGDIAILGDVVAPGVTSQPAIPPAPAVDLSATPPSTIEKMQEPASTPETDKEKELKAKVPIPNDWVPIDEEGKK